MELRQLKYFLTAKKLLNFTAAAEQLYITQSTLSQQIKQLETELGIPLFNRIGKRITLTEAAEVFAIYAEKSIKRANEGFLAMQDLLNLKRGTLRIGVSYGLRSTLISVLKSFSQKYPGIKIEINFGMTTMILEKLMNSELDFVLCFQDDRAEEHFQYQPLFTSEMTVVTAIDSEVSEQSSFKLKEISKMPLILPQIGYSTSSFIREKFRQTGLKLNLAMEINDIPTLLEMVKTGKWHTILTKSTAKEENGLRSIPIKEKALTRTAVIVSQRDIYFTTLMQAFVKEFKFQK